MDMYGLFVSVRSFTSIQNLWNNYPNGLLFAVFKKSSSPIQTDLETAHVKQYFHETNAMKPCRVGHNLRCLKCFF